MRLAALVAVIVVAISLLWLATEAHYGNCLDAVRTEQVGRTPASIVQGESPKSRVEGCSRLPF